MRNLLRGTHWLIALLIFSMPISLVFFLGSQMAYGEVQRHYDSYAALTEYTRLAELESLPAGTTILLRGTIADPSLLQSLRPTTSDKSGQIAGPLLVYQERPLDGREVRYLEEFPLVFPTLALTLADETIIVEASQAGDSVIAHELHQVTIEDRELTGFQVGDIITLQGKWQPTEEGEPTLAEVTGIAGISKAALQAEVQSSLQKVSLVRNGLGLLTLVSIILLVIQFYRQRKNQPEGSAIQQPERSPVAI